MDGEEILVFDIVIKNGRVVDGCGNTWFRADVAIENGKIVKIGGMIIDAYKVIDANEMIVAPGIVDLHEHSDTAILANPKAESAIRQGITTIVNGNCGSSAAPLTNQSMELMKARFQRHIAKPDWITYGEYLNKLEERGCAVNVAGLVGHHTVRMAVMGMDARDPTTKELEAMKRLVAQSLEEGAFGLSTGLESAPGGNSKTEEIIELAKIVARYPGALYVTHMRGRDERALNAVREGIEIGEKAGIPVHFSHHPTRYPFQGRMSELLKLHEDARERGVDVTFDVYISNFNMSSFGAMVPLDLHEGGQKKFIERLRNPDVRKRIKEYKNPEVKLFRDGKWDRILLGDNTKNKDFAGMNLAEVAKIKGYSDPWDMLMDMMIEEGEDGRLSFYCDVKTDEDISTALRHPTSMAVGSDVTALAPYGVLASTHPHPIAYGNYPQLFRKYVREMRVLTLEEAIRKVSSFPAQRMNLWDRGLIREGMWADLMIFDKNRIQDKSTFKEPHKYPEGIDYVIVNGKVVIEKGEHTGSLPGKILRPIYCKS